MRKLYRSSRDRKIFGVCGGVAEYLGFDATLLRILLIVVAVFSAGSVVIVYVLAGLIIPQEPPYGASFGGGAFGEPAAPRGSWNGSFGGWNSPPPSTGWQPGSPWPGPGAAGSDAARGPARPTAAQAAPTGTSSAQASKLDAMMEDIEKKALRREIDELKARLNKFEQQSKGEE